MSEQDRDLATEFSGRREAATAAARERGLRGLLVCARGGGTLDRYANVMYLADFYTPFPTIPDRPPLWSARGHAFVLLPVAAEPVLIVDVPLAATPQTTGVRFVVAPDVTAALVRELQSCGMGADVVGIAGADTMPWGVARLVENALPGVAFVPADEILDDLRAIKSAREVDLLRQASAIGSRTIDAMMDEAQPGATHADVYLAGQAVLIPFRAIMQNAFMISGKGGADPHVVRNSFPTFGSADPLLAGQWFQAGISGVYGGYYFDLARSTAVGEAEPEQTAAFEAAISCVDAGRDAIRPGATAGAVAAAGLGRLRDLGYDFGGAFTGMGHGIGLGWDDPWLIAGDETVLQPGMVLCVERGVKHDGFSGDFEETVLVTDAGSEVLTSAKVRRW